MVSSVSSEEQHKCFYLDSDFQPASDMLRKCVGDPMSSDLFNCSDPMRQVLPSDVKETARMNDLSIQRGFSFYNIDNYLFENNDGTNNIKKFTPSVTGGVTGGVTGVTGGVTGGVSVTEGFVNPDNIFITDNGLGKSSLAEGECPQGYTLDSKTGKCIQKCIGCIYQDNMKSADFNPSDPCSPNGVYDGITNDGDIKCTCGSRGQYCSNDFIKNMYTSDGMMVSGNNIIMNTGLTKTIDELFNFSYL